MATLADNFTARPIECRFLTGLEMGQVSEDGFTRHLLWTGFVDKNGYGRIGRRDRETGKQINTLVHRFGYERWIGPIPDGHDLDHRPDCPKNCVNPAHLTPRTKGDHIAEGFRTGERIGRWAKDPEAARADGQKGLDARWGGVV